MGGLVSQGSHAGRGVSEESRGGETDSRARWIEVEEEEAATDDSGRVSAFIARATD